MTLNSAVSTNGRFRLPCCLVLMKSVDNLLMFLFCSFSERLSSSSAAPIKARKPDKENTMAFERILNEIAAVTALFAGAYVLLMVA